jgi:hypothetical protein
VRAAYARRGELVPGELPDGVLTDAAGRADRHRVPGDWA